MLHCYTFLAAWFNPVVGNSFPLAMPPGQIGIAWKSKKCVDWLFSTQRCVNNIYPFIFNIIKLTHKYKCSHIHYSLSWKMQALINPLSLTYIFNKNFRQLFWSSYLANNYTLSIILSIMYLPDKQFSIISHFTHSPQYLISYKRTSEIFSIKLSSY